MARFDGKVALISGAASGIGAATARRFAAEGAAVMLGDINDVDGSSLAKELREGGAKAEFQRVDVADLEQVESFTQAAVDQFGRLDIVFNNAGIGAYGRTPDLEPEVWHKVIDVDLHSVFYGCRAAIPRLRENGGGAIINTASISGLFGDYGLAAYNAAKGAVMNYTRAAAADHAAENIRINAVCPGPVETALTQAILALPDAEARWSAAIPMGRLGKAEEIAGVVAFLASDDASFVTGTSIVADGGVTAVTGQVNFHQLFSPVLGDKGTVG